MCSFSPRGSFAAEIMRFVTAQAGLILPRPVLTLHSDSKIARGSAIPPLSARGEPVGSPASADRQPFNLGACWSMVTPLQLPERITKMRALSPHPERPVR